jgi:prepilin-type N-terminal cleavage/methylation domain-containing protein
MKIFSIGGKTPSNLPRRQAGSPFVQGEDMKVSDPTPYEGGVRGGLPGFSLMEMLIVVALFSITVVVMAQTFSSFNRLHRKIANRSVLSQDMRFVTESLVRAARSMPIAYSVPPAPREEEIRLELADGNLLIVKRSAVGQVDCGDTPDVACLLLSTDGGASWLPISGKRINVEKFDVYVRPDLSPFVLSGGNYPNNIQPFVTFVIQTRYVAENPKDDATLQAQTTVASRVYLR